jgi:hemerythrin-like domain-containing protein
MSLICPNSRDVPRHFSSGQSHVQRHRHLHAEHANFDMLLELLEGQLDLFHDGKSPDYALMLDIMFYMTHYPDAFHHPREDLAFARIGEREPSTCPSSTSFACSTRA